MTQAATEIDEPEHLFVERDGEAYSRIAGVQRMRPFLMSLASDTDVWMFVTSTGGLTAGRRDPDGALFPYETVDKLYDGHFHTGPLTLMRVTTADGTCELWPPFSDASGEDPRIERNLYKNVLGNRLVFEEIHRGLGLAFSYRWTGCDAFGLVRTALLESLTAAPVRVELLDGLRNVLPFGAPLALYQHSSSLIDAYKRTDLDSAARLATFSLTSTITDRAEALESLRANVAWCTGLQDARVFLSLDSVTAFRRGGHPAPESVLTGRRGNFLVHSTLELSPGERRTWHIGADSGLGHVEIAALRATLRAERDLGTRISAALERSSANLRRNVATADGLQRTARPASDAHHFANVLFNNMRGGVFAEGDGVPAADFHDFLLTRNRPVAARHAALLDALPARLAAPALLERANAVGDADLVRLCLEYLPLSFGRRHGDPSRPWNLFAIRVKNGDGSPALRYEGNWRDIFQNWEALLFSFPGFLPHAIAKFVNASTLDGFNPYRITRDGVDWEVVDPKNPWSHIGYWGDHQIVYLLRFLEAARQFLPGTLESLLPREIFAYAEVPYRLRPYAAILANPHETIDFDADLAERIAARVEAEGTDGRLLHGGDGAVRHVSLLEKLLVPALSKLSNLVLDGGIWMNTQRPEWNDANNALVGNGVSVVTLNHLARYLAFLERLLSEQGPATMPVSGGVIAWLREVGAILAAPAGAATPEQRRRALDALGLAFERYREVVSTAGPGAAEPFAAAEGAVFCATALAHVDRGLRASRRDDGLSHAYDLLDVASDPARAELHHLDVMLEGQVAAISSGALDAAEVARTAERLFESRLYRPDQKSFMLHPERVLPSFAERNRAPADRVEAVPLLRELLAAGERALLQRDVEGVYRFHATFRSASDVAAALDRLATQPRWRDAVACDRAAVLDLFKSVFRHHAFTGRSGTMYAYEGIGSVYWHMVAKLLLAVQEVAIRARVDGAPSDVQSALARAYFRIRAGLGFEKSASEYGAFPTDPYSHTPKHAGAQQPGMTGQVKEEILTRFGELGVRIDAGCVHFEPWLLSAAEFLPEAGTFECVAPDGSPRSVEMPGRSLAFTYAQVPVVYTLGESAALVRVTASDGGVHTQRGAALDAATSAALFARDGSIARIDVAVPVNGLFAG